MVEYDFRFDTDTGVLSARATMTLYRDDRLPWLSTPQQYVECHGILAPRPQLKAVA